MCCSDLTKAKSATTHPFHLINTPSFAGRSQNPNSSFFTSPRGRKCLCKYSCSQEVAKSMASSALSLSFFIVRCTKPCSTPGQSFTWTSGTWHRRGQRGSAMRSCDKRHGSRTNPKSLFFLNSTPGVRNCSRAKRKGTSYYAHSQCGTSPVIYWIDAKRGVYSWWLL